MDVREKLVELLKKADKEALPAAEMGKPYNATEVMGRMADNLIAHGVTAQEWIPVYDELPEVGGYVVCIAKRNPFSRFMPMVARIEKNGWVNPMTDQYISDVTHWIPLPQLPKGE